MLLVEQPMMKEFAEQKVKETDRLLPELITECN